MTPHRLSERQKALSQIAEAFGTPRSERSEQQERLATDGICNGMDMLGLFDKYANAFSIALEADTGSCFLCRLSETNDLWRSDVALLLAAMTDEEYNFAFEVEA